MKSVFLFSLLSLTSLAFAAQEWKVVAETINCKDKLQVLAREGENFVYVSDGSTKTKLLSENGMKFSEQNPKSVVFSNANDKNLSDASKRFTFVQPSMMDGNPPKMNISLNGVKDHCKLKLK